MITIYHKIICNVLCFLLLSFLKVHLLLFRWVHLFFNMLVQLICGVPLEMVHGSLRIGAIYMAGVLAGNVYTFIVIICAFLNMSFILIIFNTVNICQDTVKYLSDRIWSMNVSVCDFVTGSLGTSVFDMHACLMGASGGVYALLAAHLANILLVSSYIIYSFLQGNYFEKWRSHLNFSRCHNGFILHTSSVNIRLWLLQIA